MKSATRVYVVTHKKAPIPDMNGYIPIVVGDHSIEHKNGVYDNTCDNISEKNPNYCELTALYWIWKNDTESGNVGFCHYRRYFRRFKLCDIFSCFSRMKVVNHSETKNLSEKSRHTSIISVNEIDTLLKKYEIVLPYPKTGLKTTALELYCRTGGKEKDVLVLRKVVDEKYPEYLKDFDEVWNDKSLSYCNMLIANRDLLDAYCEWLFDVLFELEKRTDLTGYDKRESRIFGFLGERLLNIWVRHRKLKVKYVHVYESENEHNDMDMIRNVIRRAVYRAKEGWFLWKL